MIPIFYLYYHINKAVWNSNQTVGIIKRTFTFLTKCDLVSIYEALVRPHLEYGNVIWYPLLKRQSAAVEEVQRRSTRLVEEICHFHCEDQLRYLDLPTLSMRRTSGDLIQTVIFKKDSVFTIINFLGTVIITKPDTKPL